MHNEVGYLSLNTTFILIMCNKCLTLIKPALFYLEKVPFSLSKSNEATREVTKHAHPMHGVS